MYCGQPVEVRGEPRNYSGSIQGMPVVDPKNCGARRTAIASPPVGETVRVRRPQRLSMSLRNFGVFLASSLKLLLKRLRLAQVGRGEPLGEPMVDLREHRVSLHRLASARPQPGQARRRAE